MVCRTVTPMTHSPKRHIVIPLTKAARAIPQGHTDHEQTDAVVPGIGQKIERVRLALN
jgi:hypothetical protein